MARVIALLNMNQSIVDDPQLRAFIVATMRIFVIVLRMTTLDW